MIVKSADAERYVSRPPEKLRAALIYGPDQGLVRERAEKLARSVVPDLADPFRVAELDEPVLAADPARLADEAAALSMMGGRRVVRVRCAGNALGKLFESFLENPAGDALVVVEGGDLAKNSSLRSAFEEAENAAAIACYADSARDVADVVRETLKADGLTIAADALDEAVSALGSDRGVTRREIEKLALYAHGSGRVTIEDVRAVVGDESEARTEEACDAAGEGDVARLDRALERLWVTGMSPIGVVRASLAHFQRLALVKAQASSGGAEAAMRRLRPPVHFKREASFKAQLQRWSAPALDEALNLLLDTEELCKTTAVPAEAVCSRALFQVAARARIRG
ncbi:MAG TPA: DNA polymerase III subunit delta [Rhizomicrobium sp.]|nr:DNA polymerase III subunit delta [Rhizomicrobium sp.]